MNRAKVLETMLVLVLALGIVYWGTNNRYWLLAAMLLAVIGLIIPPLAEMIHQGWMKLAHGMGFVMNRVLLTLVFTIFLVPISFIYKLFRRGKTSMKHSGVTWFKDRNYTYTKESLENLW